MSDKYISGFFLLVAPENVEISASFIELEEGEVMESIFCSADASPEATFAWKFNDQVVSEESVLEFLEPIKKYDFTSLFNIHILSYSREQAGNYFCHISNEHGEEVSNISDTVLHKPECKYN